MQTRNPIVAGQFYPASRSACTEQIESYIKEQQTVELLPQSIVGGIVPHAGWTFSGRTAAMVFSAVKQQNKKVHTFIIFGAAHRYFGSSPAVYDKGSWATPLGDTAVDEELAQAILETGAVSSDTAAHSAEHSIEVQVPFIQHLFPDAEILPILVPPNDRAVSLGQSIGQLISRENKNIVCIGSTDLTHYGPGYGFTPMGTGDEALRWAGEVNDRRFIDLAVKLDAEALLKDAADNQSACGPGAAAATVAVAKKLGKTKGLLLFHTTSSEVMKKKMATFAADSVGYAAITF